MKKVVFIDLDCDFKMLLFQVILFLQTSFIITNTFAANTDELTDKIKALNELNAKDPIIRLSYDNYKRLVRTSPRNYSVIVMLTALDSNRECEICAMSFPEYDLLAKSWKYSNEKSNNLFFALIDVDVGNGMEAFRTLQLNHAPIVMHFPAKGKPKTKDTYEAQKSGYSAEAMSRWVNERTGISIKIVTPVDYSRFITIGVAVALVLAVLIFKRDKLSSIIYSHVLWSCLAIGFIMLFLGGHMWNTIQSPPFARNDYKTGTKSYIAISNSYQYVAETYIIAILYSSIMFGFICLNQAGKFNRKMIKLLVMIAGIAVVAFFFSALLFIFEAKFQGYPYGLSYLLDIILNFVDYVMTNLSSFGFDFFERTNFNFI